MTPTTIDNSEFEMYLYLNYLRKIYELDLDSVYLDNEDFTLENVNFTNYFEDKLKPTMLSLGYEETKDHKGFIVGNKEYYTYSDLNEERCNSLNYDGIIRQLYCVPDDKQILEYTPSSVKYFFIDKKTTDFKEVMAAIFKSAGYSNVYNKEEDLLR